MNPMEALKGSSASLLRYCNYGILWQCIAPCIAGSVGHLKKFKDLVDDRDWHPPTTGYCTHLSVTVLDFNGFHISWCWGEAIGLPKAADVEGLVLIVPVGMEILFQKRVQLRRMTHHTHLHDTNIYSALFSTRLVGFGGTLEIPFPCLCFSKVPVRSEPH